MDGDGRCGVGGVVYGCGSGVGCERDGGECVMVVVVAVEVCKRVVFVNGGTPV